MEKEYTLRYPSALQQQRNLESSLVAMLNCRRYLEHLGFEEVFGHISRDDINCIGGRKGALILNDGSRISHEDFVKSRERDTLITKVISEGGYLDLGEYPIHARKKAIITKFEGDNYEFSLSIIGTAHFPWYFFKSISGKFANMLKMTLKKPIIESQDLENFATYQQGLEDAIRREALLKYSPAPQRKTEPQEPPPENHFINPWEVKIPKLGERENEKRI